MFVCMFVCNNVVRRSIHSYRIGKIIFPESDLLLPNENKISYRRLDQPWVSDGNVEIIVRNFTWARVGRSIIRRGRDHILDGYSVTDFRVSAKSDSRVTFEVQRAHPNRCQLLRRRMHPARLSPDAQKPTAGCRGKHAELISRWGRWLHRLVRSFGVGCSCATDRLLDEW
jgi:hypothetical protein